MPLECSDVGGQDKPFSLQCSPTSGIWRCACPLPRSKLESSDTSRSSTINRSILEVIFLILCPEGVPKSALGYVFKIIRILQWKVGPSSNLATTFWTCCNFQAISKKTALCRTHCNHQLRSATHQAFFLKQDKRFASCKIILNPDVKIWGGYNKFASVGAKEKQKFGDWRLMAFSPGRSRLRCR